MKKASTPSTLLKATDMLTVLGDNVRMNFSVKRAYSASGYL